MMKGIETRKCTKCGKNLSLTEEYWYIRKSDNSYRKQCKECFRNYEKKRYKEDKKSRKNYDLVDPKTLEIVETINHNELLARLGVKFLGKATEIDGLLITEKD